MTRILAADDPGAVGEVAAALRSGLPVVLPTDTVYGLAALPADAAAIDALFDLKDRPPQRSIAVLVASPAQALELVDGADGLFARLVASFWPGPLTLVVARRAGLGYRLGGDESTIGLRCPDHGMVRALATEVGPLATTSANRHGSPTATSAAGVAADLPGVDLVVDGGTRAGPASTVVDLTGTEPIVLREGAIEAATLLQNDVEPGDR